jgi:hypothetical protein
MGVADRRQQTRVIISQLFWRHQAVGPNRSVCGWKQGIAFAEVSVNRRPDPQQFVSLLYRRQTGMYGRPPWRQRPAPPPLLFLVRNVTAHCVRLYPLDHRAAVIVPIGNRLLDPGLLRWAVTSASRPTCSATAIPASHSVSSSVVVSPSSAPCSVTATTAPVSRSTAC